jgi:trans-2,3-dihydro-3-hydroxyanthranilate isomerase
VTARPDGAAGPVVIVDACLRDGRGGSPTAVLAHRPGLDDAELARIPARTGASHVVVIHPPDGSGQTRAARFFTAAGELPGCGHGTVAAIAVLASGRVGAAGTNPESRDGSRWRLRVAGREFEATARARPGDEGAEVVDAWFDQGTVEQRPASAAERDAFLAALGLNPDLLHPADDVSVASPGRERLMVPVIDRSVLAGLRPDHDRLAAESRRYRQLGCFVYVPPSPTEVAVAGESAAGGTAAGESAAVAAARMFAPAIGVPEDVANANSCGCLAAHLLVTGRVPTVAVDQGDALGRPSRVHATAVRAGGAVATRVGGTARLLRPPA